MNESASKYEPTTRIHSKHNHNQLHATSGADFSLMKKPQDITTFNYSHLTLTLEKQKLRQNLFILGSEKKFLDLSLYCTKSKWCPSVCGFCVILLTNQQTDTGEIITSLPKGSDLHIPVKLCFGCF